MAEIIANLNCLYHSYYTQ